MNISGYQRVTEKKEETDKKSVSSVSVPPTGLFYEPFMRDLALIWEQNSKISIGEG
jgi:hypothetical protein